MHIFLWRFWLLGVNHPTCAKRNAYLGSGYHREENTVLGTCYASGPWVSMNEGLETDASEPPLVPEWERRTVESLTWQRESYLELSSSHVTDMFWIQGLQHLQIYYWRRSAIRSNVYTFIPKDHKFRSSIQDETAYTHAQRITTRIRE